MQNGAVSEEAMPWVFVAALCLNGLAILAAGLLVIWALRKGRLI